MSHCLTSEFTIAGRSFKAYSASDGRTRVNHFWVDGKFVTSRQFKATLSVTIKEADPVNLIYSTMVEAYLGLNYNEDAIPRAAEEALC
jgi:hypothetical protein